MNYKFLLHQTATHLCTSAHMYDQNYALIHFCPSEYGSEDPMLISSIIDSSLIQNDSGEMPLLFSVNKTLAFSWISVSGYYILLGPIRFFPAEFNFMHTLTFSELDISSLHLVSPVCPLQILAEDTASLYNIHLSETEELLDSQQLLLTNCSSPENDTNTLGALYQTIFEHVENSFAHNPYSHEKLEVTAIQKGDVDSLRLLLKERYPGRYGKLSDNPLRQEIYLAVVSITLASRAAIQGGLHPETSFHLSDVSIQRIDHCKVPHEIIQLTIETQIQYAQLVRELREQNSKEASTGENQHISHCKDYIFAHLHERLTVREIANAVGLECNYLSTLFKQHEHKTLKQYITEEKVNLIKRMLTFSNYSYIEIATYLGFSSQSHMGMEFKRYTGMTLKEYRTKYRNDDFMKDSMTL